MMASVIRSLRPDGSFYVTWAENPDPQTFERIVSPDGIATYSDREPFHYSFAMLAAIVDAIGGEAERLDDRTHPRGESVMVITRKGA